MVAYSILLVNDHKSYFPQLISSFTWKKTKRIISQVSSILIIIDGSNNNIADYIVCWTIIFLKSERSNNRRININNEFFAYKSCVGLRSESEMWNNNKHRRYYTSWSECQRKVLRNDTNCMQKTRFPVYASALCMRVWV